MINEKAGSSCGPAFSFNQFVLKSSVNGQLNNIVNG
jgi:hypothetical protein